MRKKATVILCCTLVLLLAVLTVIAVGGKKDNAVPSEVNDGYTVNTEISLPMQKTGIENLFYTINKSGAQVQFVRLTDGELQTVSPEGKYEIVLPSSHEEIPVTVYYVHENDSLAGVGLFVNTDAESDVHFYEFAFCRLLDMPSCFSGQGEALLAVDYDSEHLYTDKLYSDFFILDTESESVSYLFSQAQRTLNKNAQLRNDYTMLTDYLLENNTAPALFLSGRMHNLDSTACDIYQSGYMDAYNTDNRPLIKNVSGNVFYADEDTVSYWVDGGDTFTLENENGVIRSFDGDIDSDYMLKDRYLLRIADGMLYDAADDTEIFLDWSELGIHAEVLDFNVSGNGNTVAVLAVNSKSQPCIYIYHADSDRTVCYADSAYGMTVSLMAENDGTVCISLAETEDAQQCRQLIFK